MQNRASAGADQNLSQVIKIDEARIQQHLGEMVRSTVEQTLNAMLDAEADQLCNARRYEHTEARTDQRAGHYKRKLQTKAGEVELQDSQAAAGAVRDGPHRAVSPPGVVD